MRLEPLKRYKSPAYPTRQEFLVHSSSLTAEYLPDNWKKNKLVATALAVYLFGSNNSNAQSTNGVVEKVPSVIMRNQQSPEIGPSETASKDEKHATFPSIAPIFLHGDGRGATGCVVINPPVFLSEEEARQVVESELKKEQIIFDKKNVRLDSITINKRYSFRYDDEGNADTVVLDGYSSQFNLGYEVVTSRDYYELGGEYSGSTVDDYDLVKAAENLREIMKQYGKMNVAIFYDPIDDPKRDQNDAPRYEEKNYGEQEEDNEEEETHSTAIHHQVDASPSIEHLRRQVQDFIEWIKKEGLLKER